MVSSFISRLVILVFGTLYPAYASYKAVRTKNVKEYVKWMMYWIVFALFTCAETFTDLFFSFWFPFYYEIKIITVIYLLSPATKGSSILYRKFVHPVLIKREQEIDEYIAKAKEQGYHTMLNLGSKGVTYATSLIMQTAIKGGGGLVNQLRRSYSLSDLNEEQGSRRKNGHCDDDRDGPYVEDAGLIKRQFVQSPHGIPPADLYFSEVDYCQRSIREDFRHIPSEEISSGYSSADHFYYGMQREKGDHLVRTASLGPSSRVRTRAATKNGLPKRASLLEGGSSWSALEPLESQNETDMQFKFPLAHSASLPFSFPPLQHLFIPEYQHMSRNLTQNQMFTFINKAQYAQFVSDEIANYEKNVDADKMENSGNSIIITEENSEDLGSRAIKESFVPAASDVIRNPVTNEEMKVEEFKPGTFINGKTENDIPRNETENENSEVNSNKCVEEKEKVLPERSGKHNKKPAPFPPTEEQNSKITLNAIVEDKEIALFTPNVSPKSNEIHSSGSMDLSVKKSCPDYDLETRPPENNFLEGPKKSKVKMKKDSKPKKLHMPKMTFSFWHAKGGKQTSASESSSIASVDISASKSDNKNDLENFIPLKGNVDISDESDLKKESE